MKNYMQETIRKFMEDNKVVMGQRFMLFMNNTDDDTYYGTWRFIKALGGRDRAELDCISFPSLLIDQYVNDDDIRRSVTEGLLEGEYEIRLLKDDGTPKKSDGIKGAKAYVLTFGTSGPDSFPEATRVFAEKKDAIDALKEVFGREVGEQKFCDDDRKRLEKEFGDGLAKGELRYEFESAIDGFYYSAYVTEVTVE